MFSGGCSREFCVSDFTLPMGLGAGTVWCVVLFCLVCCFILCVTNSGSDFFLTFCLCQSVSFAFRGVVVGVLQCSLFLYFPTFVSGGYSGPELVTFVCVCVWVNSGPDCFVPYVLSVSICVVCFRGVVVGVLHCLFPIFPPLALRWLP